MPKPMPVLIEDSRFLTTAEIASRFSGLILPVVTRFLISSSMASQRLPALISGMICSGPRMSPKSIASWHFALKQMAFQELKEPPDLLNKLSRAFKPPAERSEDPDPFDQQRNP